MPAWLSRKPAGDHTSSSAVSSMRRRVVVVLKVPSFEFPRPRLLDIYLAVESRGVFSLHRHPPSRHCPVGVNIGTVLNEVLDEVDSAVERVLANITIKDVVSRLRPCVSKASVKGVSTASVKRKNGTKEQVLLARN